MKDKETPPQLAKHLETVRKYLTKEKADAFEAAWRRMHARAHEINPSALEQAFDKIGKQ